VVDDLRIVRDRVLLGCGKSDLACDADQKQMGGWGQLMDDLGDRGAMLRGGGEVAVAVVDRRVRGSREGRRVAGEPEVDDCDGDARAIVPGNLPDVGVCRDDALVDSLGQHHRRWANAGDSGARGEDVKRSGWNESLDEAVCRQDRGATRLLNRPLCGGESARCGFDDHPDAVVRNVQALRPRGRDRRCGPAEPLRLRDGRQPRVETGRSLLDALKVELRRRACACPAGKRGEHAQNRDGHGCPLHQF
jgi:hypothetical protein